MADNIVLPESDLGGSTVAGDDIGGIIFPRSKIVIGADGTNDGDVSAANPLPVAGAVTNAGTFAVQAAQTGTWTVDLGATDNGVLDAIAASLAGTLTVGSHAVTNGGTFAVQEDGAALTALQLIDDAIYTTGTGTPSKGMAAMGSDGTNPRFITVDASGHVQIDVLSSALPSGAATAANQTTIIGHIDGIESSLGDAVTALQIIDDWDETNRCKVNLIVGQAGITGGAGAVDATTIRTVAATDDPGVALLTTIDVDTGNIATAASAIQTAVQIMDDWDESDRAKVNLIVGQAGIAGGTGTDGATVPRVTLATNVGLPAGTNNIGDVDVLTIAAGSNLVGDVGIQGRTTGGLSTYWDNDLDETAVAVKGSAGTLYSIHAINMTAAPLYLQLFDVAQGSVTVGTTTPTMQFVIPANADSDGAGFTLSVPQGIAFGTAITAAASTNNAGNGAPDANACHVNLFYK